jgi:hypothetical protein
MKTRFEYKFMSVQQKCLLMERGRTRILADSARKINRKEVLANYNKTIINICHQHNRWMKLKVALRVHQCHCAYSLNTELGQILK